MFPLSQDVKNNVHSYFRLLAVSTEMDQTEIPQNTLILLETISCCSNFPHLYIYIKRIRIMLLLVWKYSRFCPLWTAAASPSESWNVQPAGLLRSAPSRCTACLLKSTARISFEFFLLYFSPEAKGTDVNNYPHLPKMSCNISRHLDVSSWEEDQINT